MPLKKPSGPFSLSIFFMTSTAVRPLLELSTCNRVLIDHIGFVIVTAEKP